MKNADLEVMEFSFSPSFCFFLYIPPPLLLLSMVSFSSAGLVPRTGLLQDEFSPVISVRNGTGGTPRGMVPLLVSS